MFESQGAFQAFRRRRFSVLMALATIPALIASAIAPDPTEAEKGRRKNGHSGSGGNGRSHHKRGHSGSNEAGKNHNKRKQESSDAGKGGPKKVEAQVVGGKGVPDGKYPFLVALGYSDKSGNFLRRNQFCGASLIAPSYVLTAAHCVAGTKPSELAVALGRMDLNTSAGEVRAIAGFKIHPNHNPKSNGYDVAVLRLAEPVENIAPISLAAADDSTLQEAGDLVTLTGWGDTVSLRKRRHSAYPARLQERTVAIIGDGPCNRKWRRAGYHQGIAQEVMICRPAQKSGPGDSGSPVFSSVNGEFVQVGIVSGGSASTGKNPAPDYDTQVNAPSIASFIAEAMASETS